MTGTDVAPVIRRGRVEDAEGVAQTHIASWRATYPGLISSETLATLDTRAQAAMWRERLTILTSDPPPRGEALYVAADAVVGFARGGRSRPLASGEPPAPYDGELYAIYLRPGATRRGTGTRLVHALANHLAADGLSSLLIWVLSANPSRAFYEALCGAPVFTQDTIFLNERVAETGYGWSDIHDLIWRTAD